MDLEEFGQIGVSSRSRRKCLLGVTITLVEDSLSASEALRLMAVASGARMRRADRLMSAERHLALYRPTVVIVDLGLPDGSGLDLIAGLAEMSDPRPGLIAFSGGDLAEWQEDAMAAGADAVLPKPVGSLDAFQKVVLSVLPDREDRATSVTTIGSMRSILPPKVRRDDLAHALQLLDTAAEEDGGEALLYASQFIASLAVMIEDNGLQVEAGRLLATAPEVGAADSAVSRLRGLIEERLKQETARIDASNCA